MAGAVIRKEEQNRVIAFADLFEVARQLTDVLVDRINATSIRSHDRVEVVALFLSKRVPFRPEVRRGIDVRADKAQGLLFREPSLHQCFPAGPVFSLVFHKLVEF